MRNLTLYIVICILSFASLFAEEESQIFRFYDETANVLPKGDFKYSLFKNAEYGITDDLSVMAHPLLVFVNPSIDVKYNFYKKDELTISSIHGINYPTLMMNSVKGSGTGGFISPEFKIPIMFSIHNGVIATYKLDNSHFLTGKIAFEFALNNSDLAPGTSLDIPVILPRTMVYYKSTGFDIVLASEGSIWHTFDYHASTEFFLFPFGGTNYEKEYSENSTDFFMEINGGAYWNVVKSAKLGITGKLCYGQYPFGSQWHLIPYLDFVKYIE
ncbi:hypothetical protein D9V86_11160 [Bacteroidetes/Chlorobi group bacterium ChocPot_Mid]|nr:MAG: hypothetical protein D9V86_11160 [Bacteroidetes/Chlorobi group bacterium ChocPot_Mid]